VSASEARLARRAAPWLGALLLVLLFAALAFPWQRLAPAALAAVEARTGVRIEARELASTVGLRGPLVVARGVRVALPGAVPIAFDEARARPALSLDWLRGRPVAWVEIDAPFGSWRGALGTHRIAGQLEGGDLSAFPFGAMATPWSGLTSLDLSLVRGEGGTWTGDVVIASEDGGFSPPGLAVGVPYDRFEGRLTLEPGGGARVDGFEMEGPMLAATGSGSLGQLLPDPAAALLDLEVELTLRDQSLRPTIESAGLPLGPDAKARLRVVGPPAGPQVELRP
jgi:type II secretion system protein N